MILVKDITRHPWLFVRSLIRRAYNDSLLRNSIYIMGTNVVTASFGYIFWIVAAHMYSTYDVGLGSALISAMTLASAFANLGIGFALVQKLPHRSTGYQWSLTLNAGLVTGSLVGLLGGIIVVAMFPLFGPQLAIVQHNFGYAFAFIIGVPALTVTMLLDQAFIAERASGNMLVRNLVVAVLKIPLLVLPLLLIGQVGAAGILLSGVVAMVISLIGGMLLLLPRLGRAYCLALRGMVGQIRSMFSSLVWNHFINLGGLIPYYLFPLLVAARLSPAENAYYYITMRIGDFFFMASSAVTMSLFAEGSYTTSDLRRKVQTSSMTIGILFIPAMLICFFGGRIILLVFGPDYAQHGLILLMIFAIEAIPDAIINIHVSVLRVQNRLHFAAILRLCVAALTLILGWILLPVLGIIGVGLAFVIAQTTGSLVAGIDYIRIHQQRREISKPAIHGNEE